MTMLEYYALAARSADLRYTAAHERVCAAARALPQGQHTSLAYKRASSDCTDAAVDTNNARTVLLKEALTGAYGASSNLEMCAISYRSAMKAYQAADEQSMGATDETWASSHELCRVTATAVGRAETDLFIAAYKFVV